jgi:FkbM family methyltransferase
MAWRRRLFELADTPGLRFALGARRSAELALRPREACLVSPDGDGGWVHRYRQGTLVYPEPRGPSWRHYARITEEVFLHGYRPRQGDVVVDVGAGFGTEIVSLAPMVGPGGRVLAVEAHPFICRLLGRTVTRNGFENVDVVRAAVSDIAGTSRISDETGPAYEGNRLGDRGLEVATTTLDALIVNLGLERIDLLKMNIEGAEAAALRGLARGAPVIRNVVVSCHDFLANDTGDDGYRTREEVTRLLRDYGFRISRREDPRAWIADYVYASRPC